MPEIIINREYLLLVEGNDDLLFFQSLFKYLNENRIQIIPLDGKDNFSNQIRQIVKAPNFENVKVIGITRDSDDSFDRAFQSIITVLRSLNIACPNSVLERTSQQKPDTIIYLLPTVGANGELEDLLISSFQNDSIYQCIQNYFECAKRNIEYSLLDESKGKVQVYLASKERYIKDIGVAAAKGIWNFQDVVFNDLKLFIRKIVE